MSGKIRSIEDLLNLLNRVKYMKPNQWMARCPSHNDGARPDHWSLSITALPDKILLNCLAGCPINSVLAALKIEMSDLFLNSHKPESYLKGYKEIEATYDYHSAEGKVLFQVVRFKPKSFAQRRPGGEKGWIWGIKPLYPLNLCWRYKMANGKKISVMNPMGLSA